MVEKERIMNFLVVIFGNILLAFGVSLFILPFNIANGGVSGVSIILERFFNPALTILFVNWILFFIGWIFLKKDFAMKTLVSTIVYPSIINIVYYTSLPNTIKTQVNDPLLAAILGAILIGVGLGLVYRVGGSTGGFDVVSVLLNKYKGIKISISTFFIDSFIVLLGIFTVSINSGLYGIICVIITSYLIETIIMTNNSSYMMHIISDKSEEINNYIINELNRGSTIIIAKGGINLDDKKMIEVIFNEKEFYQIKHNIEKIDKDAFVSVYKAINVYGNGFTRLSDK